MGFTRHPISKTIFARFRCDDSYVDRNALEEYKVPNGGFEWMQWDYRIEVETELFKQGKSRQLERLNQAEIADRKRVKHGGPLRVYGVDGVNCPELSRVGENKDNWQRRHMNGEKKTDGSYTNPRYRCKNMTAKDIDFHYHKAPLIQ